MTNITLDTFILQTLDDLELFRAEMTSLGASFETYTVSDCIETFAYWLNDKYSGEPSHASGED